MATKLGQRPAVGVEARVTRKLFAVKRNNVIGVLVLVVIVGALPFFASANLLNTAVFTMIFIFPAIGLSLLMGLGGQVSLGQAAFFAIGAYTHVILIQRFDLHPLPAAALAVAMSSLVALLVGLPIFRLRGHFLALATLGLSFIVTIAVRQWEFTGKTTGLYGFGRIEAFGFTISNNAFFLWFITPFVVIALIFALNLAASRPGVALSALNDSEIAAESLGADTFRLRLQVFVVSAAFSAVGGIFYAYQVQVVNTEIASFHLSIQILLMVVIGGLGSVWGAVVGAFVIEFLSTMLRDLIPLVIPGASGEVELIGYGVVIIAVILLFPGGVRDLVTSLLPKKHNSHDEHHEQSERSTDFQSLGLQFAAARRSSSKIKAVEVQHLTKSYGGVTAVDAVTFVAHTGKITGLIGPNGAGKTTCFNMISGAVEPSEGRVLLFGEEVQGKKPHVAAKLGMTRTFQNLQTFSSSNVVGNVYMGRYRMGTVGMWLGALGLRAAEQEQEMRIAYRLLSSLGLGDVWDSPATDLSFGQQRIMEICRAIAHEPSVLLLDEPLAGLSTIERGLLAQLLRQLRDYGITILLVEHDVAHVMALADEVVVLDNGRLIAQGTPEQVQKNSAVIEAYLGVDNESPSMGNDIQVDDSPGASTMEEGK